MPGAEIDDAEAAHSDGARAIDMEAFIVRAAMPDLVAHSANFGEFGPARDEKLSGDSTHKSLSFSVNLLIIATAMPFRVTPIKMCISE
jgi:hypothetical protein